jgi:hypothetical protein
VLAVVVAPEPDAAVEDDEGADEDEVVDVPDAGVDDAVDVEEVDGASRPPTCDGLVTSAGWVTTVGGTGWRAAISYAATATASAATASHPTNRGDTPNGGCDGAPGSSGSLSMRAAERIRPPHAGSVHGSALSNFELLNFELRTKEAPSAHLHY